MGLGFVRLSLRRGHHLSSKTKHVLICFVTVLDNVSQCPVPEVILGTDHYFFKQTVISPLQCHWVFLQNNDLNSIAKGFLDESDRVFFLGFAYHELNMKILGFGENSNFKTKKIAGTSLNMGNIEIKGIQKRYPEIKLLQPVDCLTFFRDYFSITDPSLDEI